MKSRHYTSVTRPIDDLIPYINNSRTHSDQQINQIASSIKEFGFTNPVLIDEDNGIIAGHGRTLAANKLGIKELPCIIIEGLTKAQKKAYMIADNQLPLNAEWDFEILQLELDSLKELDFNLVLTGFDDGFINNLIDGIDYLGKNKELNLDDFSDLIEMKLIFSSDQYEAVKLELIKHGDSPELAILQVLGL